MRALVISGGGSKGAFAGGLAQYLIEEKGINYDMFIGTSTGSLLITHLATNRIGRLKEVFTSAKQTDVFNVCPFKITKENGVFKSRINHWQILWQFIKRKRTFGESHALRKLIERAITHDDYTDAKESFRHLVVTVSNLTCNRVEYKYIKDCTYEEYLDWIWISANMVPFMSLVEKNGHEYADGGFGNLVPVQEAINLGAKEVDVIVLAPRHKVVHKERNSNAFGVLLSTMDFMLNQIRQDDIFIGNLESIYNDVHMRFYYTPRILTENSFIFDPTQMLEWWNEGYEYGRVITP